MGNYRLEYVGGKSSWSMCDCRKKAVALAVRTDAVAPKQRLCPECLTRFVAQAQSQGFAIQADPKLQRYLPEDTSNREASNRAAGPGATPCDAEMTRVEAGERERRFRLNLSERSVRL